MQHIMLSASGTVDIPEGFPNQGFNFAVFFRSFRTNNNIMIHFTIIHCHFSARRISQVSVESGKEIVDQDYAQFGGKVAITFDARIPLFNIRTIADEKGNKVFDCVTIGTIKSSEDKSFEAFKGVSAPKPAVSKETRKATKSKVCKFENRQVTLDEDWEQKMENFWTLGNDSLITMSVLPKVAENQILNDLYVI